MGGRAALRQGAWKIHRASASEPWQLYNLEQDIGEAHDLAAEQSGRLAELKSAWMALDTEMIEPLSGWTTKMNTV